MEDPRLNPRDTKTQALIRAKAYNWLDSLFTRIQNKNKTEVDDRTAFELGNFFGEESSTARSFTIDRITLRRPYAKKQLELVDSGGFNLIDNKHVPWKEVYIRNIKIVCSSSSKELEIKNIYLEVDNVLTYMQISDIERAYSGPRPMMAQIRRLQELFPNSQFSNLQTKYIVTNLRRDVDHGGRISMVEFLKHDWSDGYYYIFKVTDNANAFRRLKQLESHLERVMLIEIILDAHDTEAM